MPKIDTLDALDDEAVYWVSIQGGFLTVPPNFQYQNEKR